MKANAACAKCGCRWYLAPHEHDVICNRKLGRKVCGGLVIRDETREALLAIYPTTTLGITHARVQERKGS